MKRKLSIPTDRAAYGPSQPLFDAIRGATSTLSSLEVTLSTVRDEIQRIHVFLDKPSTQRLSCTIFKSWAESNLVFSSIFDQLTDVSHVSDAVADDAARLDINVARTARAHAQMAGNLGLMAAGIKSDETLADYSPEMPRDTEGSAKRRKVETRRPRGTHNGHANGVSGRASTEDLAYRDISAEVEGKLREKEAKERAKREAKKEKKRKRDTADSLEGVQGGTEHLGLGSGAHTPAHDVAPEPTEEKGVRRKKKARHDIGQDEAEHTTSAPGQADGDRAASDVYEAEADAASKHQDHGTRDVRSSRKRSGAAAHPPDEAAQASGSKDSARAKKKRRR